MTYQQFQLLILLLHLKSQQILNTQGYTECKQEHIYIKDLKDIKQVVSYGRHSPYVRELIKTRASRNKITPHDWLQLVSAELEDGHRYSGSTIGERRIRPWNIEIEQEHLRPPKIKFLVKALMLIQVVKLYTMNTSCPYAIEQP